MAFFVFELACILALTRVCVVARKKARRQNRTKAIAADIIQRLGKERTNPIWIGICGVRTSFYNIIIWKEKQCERKLTG